jgi:hypothetical protein
MSDFAAEIDALSIKSNTVIRNVLKTRTKRKGIMVLFITDYVSE